MEDIQQNILNWLQSLKGWQCELAYRILTKHQLEERDINKIVSMMKDGKQYDGKVFPSLGTSINGHNVILMSIDSVENIEQLAPRNALKFAETGITVIYGYNGTGKSGYVRILKKLSGKPSSRELRDNIYQPSKNVGKCQLTYKLDGTEKVCEWKTTDAVIEDLKVVDIFDSDMGLAYLNQDNEVSYIPSVIGFFSQFTDAHDKIKEILLTEKARFQTKLPPPPTRLSDTDFIKNIYHATKLDISKFVWTEKDEKEIYELEQKLKESDFLKIANGIRIKKQKLDALTKEIQACSQKVTTQNEQEIVNIKETLETSKQAVIDASDALNDVSKLNGIGTESWKKLWFAAKDYAVQEAYKTNVPLSELEYCVLCHQPLSLDAKTRLQRFDTFISNKLSADVVDAQKKYDEKIKSLPMSLTDDAIDNKCIASGLDEKQHAQVSQIFAKIYNNAIAIRDGHTICDISDEITAILSVLNKIGEQYEQNALKFEEAAKSFDRDAGEKQLQELKAQEWCYAQLDYIKAEILQKGEVVKYNEWISQTDTHNITAKAKEIGDIVITQSYIKRFNAELKKLGAEKIKVVLDKKSTKGAILYSLRIDSTKYHKPLEILSEGEVRIVELAAFLADVTGGTNNNPFIFDDPISSLDYIYEENTARRLAELSKTRQVIVFTHRLSLLSQLNETCDKIKPVGIRNEIWGTGEITDLPFSAKKPATALKGLLNRLPEVEKILAVSGYDAYYPFGKSLCSDFRILLERVVENQLLCGVIERFRRQINTKNKISKLANINKTDCDLIDGFMTKYSYYEHSQPSETPIDLPKPDEIKKDVTELILWIGEFEMRRDNP